MVAAIAKNKKRILPCAAYLEGQYGLSDVFVGVPVKLGSAGIAEIIEVDLTDDERDSLQESAEHVKASVKNLTL
jgi:malate dehydrogenase